MALPQVDIVTAAEIVVASSTPLAGALVTYELDRGDQDILTNILIIKEAEKTVSLDAAGRLPTGALKLWANTRGSQGSRWLIGLRMGTTWLIEPVPVRVPEPTLPATTIDLMALWTTHALPALFIPGCKR
jgi:hypothetical protein